MDVLPDLPIDDGTDAGRGEATGTDARTLVPDSDKRSHLWTNAVQLARRHGDQPENDRFAHTLENVASRTPLSSADNGGEEMERTGIEPATPSLQSWCSPN